MKKWVKIVSFIPIYSFLGPMSDEVLVHTAEGAPTMPPEDITMTTLNAASIKVTWASPPLVSANGVIKGI